MDTTWRGAGDQIVVALGSAGAFSAAASCLRAWLGRDASRRIDVGWDAAGAGHLVTLTGAAADVQVVREIARAMVSRGLSPTVTRE